MSIRTVTQTETIAGVTNVVAIIDSNFAALNNLLDPVHDNHLNDGTAADVANRVRDRVFGDEPETLTGTTVDIDFDTEASKSYFDIAAGLTFTFSNAGRGKFVYLVLRALDTGSPETLTWPASSIVRWLNQGGAPAAVGKYMLIKLYCLGGDAATTLVYGEYIEEA